MTDVVRPDGAHPVLVYRVSWWVLGSTVAVLAWGAATFVRWSVPWPVALFFGLGAAGIAWRTLQVAVLAYPDRLVVRNTWHTERISRSVIDGFGIGRSSTSLVGRGLVVSTRHGRLVSADALTGPYGLRRARRAAERLTDWLAEDGPPAGRPGAAL